MSRKTFCLSVFSFQGAGAFAPLPSLERSPAATSALRVLRVSTLRNLSGAIPCDTMRLGCPARNGDFLARLSILRVPGKCSVDKVLTVRGFRPLAVYASDYSTDANECQEIFFVFSNLYTFAVLSKFDDPFSYLASRNMIF